MKISENILGSKVVVVAGGAGEVGEGVVRVLLQSGATVIVPSRSDEKIAILKEAVKSVMSGKLLSVKLNVAEREGIDELLTLIEEEGRLDAIIASIGGFWQGPNLLKLEAEIIKSGIEQRVLPHLHLIQSLVPKLNTDGVFIHFSGLVALFGMPGLSALGVSTAAQLAVTRALLAESSGTGLRVYALVIEQFVKTRSRQDLPLDALTADDVGEVTRDLILSDKPGDIFGLRKVNGNVAFEPLPPPISPASVERLTQSLNQS